MLWNWVNLGTIFFHAPGHNTDGRYQDKCLFCFWNTFLSGIRIDLSRLAFGKALNTGLCAQDGGPECALFLGYVDTDKFEMSSYTKNNKICNEIRQRIAGIL